MKPIINELNKFMAENFKDLVLESPLFYKWNLALRFDLQPNSEGTVSPWMDEYFNFVQNRAISLFEGAFSNDDDMFIVFTRYRRHKRSKIRRWNLAFKCISNLSKNEINYDRVTNSYHDGEWGHFYNRVVIKTNFNRIDYKLLVKAISHKDFGRRKPRFALDIFFININKKAIFYQYDDRGLDYLASDYATIYPFYKKFDEWILEYDRAEIESILNPMIG